MIFCCEMAPASLQPSQPDVLVTELPFAVAFTRLVHVTVSAAAVLGAGADDGVETSDGADGVLADGAGAGAGLDPAAMAAAIAVKSAPTSLPSVPARTYGVPGART